MDIIDTHVHLWDADLWCCPWISNAPEWMQKAHRYDDYAVEMGKCSLGRISACIFMETDAAGADRFVENAHHGGFVQQRGYTHVGNNCRSRHV